MTAKKYTAQLIEVGGGFKGSTAHVATFEINSVDDLRSMAAHLYEDMTIVIGRKKVMGIQDNLREMSRLAQLVCAQTGQQRDQDLFLRIKDRLEEWVLLEMDAKIPGKEKSPDIGNGETVKP